MNGAHALLDSLVKAGVEICFANSRHVRNAPGHRDR